MLEWVQKLFGLEILLSAVSAFGRPDYNLPLFVFAFMIWDFPKVLKYSHHKSQHTRVIYLLIFSTFIDTIYLIYWGMLWHSKLFQEYAYDNLIHEIVLDVSIAILVVKVLIFF